MLILPDNTPEDAVTRAEKLRQAVESVSVRYGEKSLPRITISIGVAHYPTHGHMPQDLMRSADDALYAAKDKGRNQMQVARGISRHEHADQQARNELGAAIPPANAA